MVKYKRKMIYFLVIVLILILVIIVFRKDIGFSPSKLSEKSVNSNAPVSNWIANNFGENRNDKNADSVRSKLMALQVAVK